MKIHTIILAAGEGSRMISKKAKSGIIFEFNERTIMLQSQMPWLLLPWFFYATLINLNQIK